VVRLDAGLAAEFMDESGHLKSTGSVATNAELADTLAAIRTQGAEALYTGVIGDKIVAYSASQGGAIGRADLEAHPSARTTPRVLQMGGDYVFLPTSRTGAGAFAGALFDNLARAQATPSGSRDTEAAVIVAVKETLSGFGLNSLPADLGATGFAATDAKGQAVACAVTMNGPFGSGHTALGTGVTLARAPSSGVVGLASAFLTPVIASPSGDRPATLAGAGAGGPNGSAAIAYALTRIAHGEEILTRRDLHSTGVAPYDNVNAIVCTDSVCAALPDPAASGLGAAVPLQ
jgi:gamma-glutamyltranspeptidase/glutathione hydrolase